MEELKKKTNEIQQLSSNNAFQFASKLINRSSSSKKDDDFENLRKKLEIQEEEFKLQQSTLFQEMNSLSAENDKLKNQLKSHPLEKGPENNSDFEEQLEKMTKKAEDSEKLTRDLEDMLLENRKKLEDSKKEIGRFWRATKGIGQY
ncbi:unnamed protein product [Caenorhabditis angaria]|uniref:Uncharacterized protein n=1 Tax=Caenorhabditis angaria TaxID=860376 RepID=A0A9P1ING5_9PELO|nr:unnamed protein product [Caenorhabditis angaria]